MPLPTEVKTRKTLDRGAYVQNKDIVSVQDDGKRKITFDEVRKHVWSKNPELKSRAAKWLIWYLADYYASREMTKKS